MEEQSNVPSSTESVAPEATPDHSSEKSPRRKRLKMTLIIFVSLIVVVVAAYVIYSWAQTTAQQSNATSKDTSPKDLNGKVIENEVLAFHPTLAESVAIPNPTVFSDNFNNLQLSGWTKVDEGVDVPGPSSWTPLAGYLSGVVNSSGNIFADAGLPTINKPGTYFYAGNAGWRDYQYNVRLKTNDDDAFGLMFRYTDNNNYYRFSMDRQRGYMRLVKKVAGTYSLVWEKTGILPTTDTGNASTDAYKKNQWYTLSISAIGADISFSLVDESGTTPTVDATVSDSSLASGMVALYAWGMDGAFFDDVKVVAKVSQGFTIAVLPDTQDYVSENSSTSAFTKQTQWIADNRGQRKIVYVLHEGDIINDICANSQWTSASNSLKVLDGKVPYSFAPGNHDIIAYGGDSSGVHPNCIGVTDPTSPAITYMAKTIYTNKINEFFPATRYSDGENFGGTKDTNNTANSYSFFSASGLDFIVISLQFGPDDATLAWAKAVAAQNPNRHAILLTHDYLSQNSQLRGTYRRGSTKCPSPAANSTDPTACRCPEAASNGPLTVTRCTSDNSWDNSDLSYDWALPSISGQNSGVKMWDKLVSSTSNINFVFNGHVASAYVQNATAYQPLRIDTAREGNVGKLTSTRSDGTSVYQMLADYQSVGTDAQTGYMRLLKFTPNANGDGKWSVDVSTYSPILNTFLTDINGVITDVPVGSNIPGATNSRTLDGKNQFILNNVSL